MVETQVHYTHLENFFFLKFCILSNHQKYLKDHATTSICNLLNILLGSKGFDVEFVESQVEQVNVIRVHPFSLRHWIRETPSENKDICARVSIRGEGGIYNSSGK